MPGGDVNPQPIQLVINYWEIRPSMMNARLDELLRLGITHVSSFIPWQALESDISHTLPRFLQGLSERKMTVSLILSPEVGVHYPHSGIPKDVLSKPENVARHFEDGLVSVHLPPNAFALPSLLSSEFTKRFHNFLSRMDNFLADIGRWQPEVLEGVTVALTGSFWKYYRSPRLSAEHAFDGPCGDYSGVASMAFRQYADLFFSQKEFVDSNTSSSGRWKTRALEDVNRRYFYQQSEDVFRNRSIQFVRRKALPVNVASMELFTPEADPAFSYSTFFQLAAGSGPNFAQFSSFLDEAISRSSEAGDKSSSPFVHWTSLGGFKVLSDSEKQFLILKSLLLMGGAGGGVFIDEAEWFSLSQPFRARLEGLARMIATGALRLSSGALYLTPHLWSGMSVLWQELQGRLGSQARLVSSVDHAIHDQDASMCVVDPTCILTREAILKLVHWARSGRLVAIPRGPLYTEAARHSLESILGDQSGMDINVGVAYQMYSLGDGKMVLYNLPEGLSTQGEALKCWQTFLSSLLSVANVDTCCKLSDGRLQVIALNRHRGGRGIFVMNGSRRQINASVLFPKEVLISDLSLVFTGKALSSEVPVVPSNRFEFDIPSCGVLSLGVSGLDTEEEERLCAGVTAKAMEEAVGAVALNELPGLGPEEDQQSPWN